MCYSLARYWDGSCIYQIRTLTYTISPERRHIRLCVNNVPPSSTLADRMIVALRPIVDIPQDVYERLVDIHNSLRGHVGFKLCNRRPKSYVNSVSNTILNLKTWSLSDCYYCQTTNRLRLPIKAHRFTCASYNPFDVLHLDHIGPLTKRVDDSYRDSVGLAQTYRSIWKFLSHS